ncbi:uncharacterized protein LOC129732138 [Wyeomyia smithii]|uniref:uncharacterized protein LOC129732138 n=1 Tax=Wyeomyia smithii TaxID=174621 RepID=UPI0024680821|nr:uncharacterized protein LOC129732138 [Wyeomyia smithii]
MKWLLLLVLHMVTGSRLTVHDSSSSENRASSAAQFCTDLNPQTGLDIEQIMGLWYGSEVITHLGSEDGESIYDTCVVIHLSDITNSTPTSERPYREQGPDVRYGTSFGYPGDRGQYGSTEDYGNRRYQNREGYQQHHYRQHQSSTRYMRLIWDEKDHTLEYTLRYNNSRPGFWISSSPQAGSMVQLSYMQFTGTVQVLKAINNQLVLTFCQSLPGGQLFSVVLSRQHMGLSPEENYSIRNLLKRRNLSTLSVRKVCYNGATSQTSFGLWIVLLVSSLLLAVSK